jgi:hypothetical protein
VNQANQVFIILKHMKVTLLYLEKKTEYDLSIRKIGGLADIIARIASISSQPGFEIKSATTYKIGRTSG